jgi:cytochrome c553
MKKIHSFFLIMTLAALSAASFAQTAAPVSAAPATSTTAVTPAVGDAKAGRQKAVAICSGCHGVTGTKTAFPEVYHVPKIGGQSAAYIVSALKAYRSGERYNQTMKGLASALTEKDVADIAAYYADPSMGRITSK